MIKRVLTEIFLTIESILFWIFALVLTALVVFFAGLKEPSHS